MNHSSTSSFRVRRRSLSCATSCPGRSLPGRDVEDERVSEKVEPIVFVKKYGKGRVVHNVLGHDLKSRGSESCATLLSRGVEWAATGKVAAK